MVLQEAMDILEEEDMEVEVMEEVVAVKQSTNKNATQQVSNNALPLLINNVLQSTNSNAPLPTNKNALPATKL